MDCSENEPRSLQCKTLKTAFNISYIWRRSSHRAVYTFRDHYKNQAFNAVGLYTEINPFCSAFHTKYRHVFCAQNVEFLYVKPGGTWSNHWDIEGQECTTRYPKAQGQHHPHSRALARRPIHTKLNWHTHTHTHTHTLNKYVVHRLLDNNCSITMAIRDSEHYYTVTFRITVQVRMKTARVYCPHARVAESLCSSCTHRKLNNPTFIPECSTSSQFWRPAVYWRSVMLFAALKRNGSLETCVRRMNDAKCRRENPWLQRINQT